MWLYLMTLAAAAALVNSHGRLLNPAGRSTLWRVGFKNAKVNYQDHELFCGGFYRQHTVNGGKCGICGDPYDAPKPRPHERGGFYDSGIIAGSYEAGSIIPITVQITAHHKGYWEFRICPDPDSTLQECFDQYLLELETGGTKYYPKQGSTKYVVNYIIPEDLTCDNCVLQWRYTCGNNWGVCRNGTSGLGCGDQESFWACSDITITGGSGLSHQYSQPEVERRTTPQRIKSTNDSDVNTKTNIKHLTAVITSLTNELTTLKTKLEKVAHSLRQCHEKMDYLENRVASNANRLTNLEKSKSV